MRFREANELDIPAIEASFDGRNALPLEPRVRAALPALLKRLIASPAATLTVFEDDHQPGLPFVSFAGGLFLRAAVIADYLAAPFPGLLSSALAAMLDNRRPLLTLDEIRLDNSAEGLTLGVFPIPLGNRAWDDARTEQLRRLAPQAFMRYYAGYRLKAIYYEVFTDEVAAYLKLGGYRLLHDFSSGAGTNVLDAHCRPRMFRLARADLAPGAMSMATQFFDPPPARLGLTPAEQRVALKALDGLSDRALAEGLNLSTETVRSCWRSIYQRLEQATPALRAAADESERSTRGREKRRIAIEHLRQNMHELRPWVARTAKP
jgi:DNA-binding CsgD family transcriptional regulator